MIGVQSQMRTRSVRERLLKRPEPTGQFRVNIHRKRIRHCTHRRPEIAEHLTEFGVARSCRARRIDHCLVDIGQATAPPGTGTSPCQACARSDHGLT